MALLLQPVPQSTTGTVEGTIVRAGSADPLPDVRVTLQQEAILLTNHPPDSVLQNSPARTAISDRAGRFVIRDVRAGLHTISLQREGFSGSSTNASSITVTDGETVELRLSMIPGGVIRGRVLDSSGRLLPNATVQALSRVFENGIGSLQPVVSRTTDDRGEYRLFGVPPGDYYVSAAPRPAVTRPTTTTGTLRDTRTFYRSATSISTAAPVTVSAGAEVRDVDILVASQLHLRVSGRAVSDLTPRVPDSRATLHLVPRDPGVPDDPAARSEVSVVLKPSSAEFEILNVEPGAYDLFAVIDSPQGPAISRFPVNVIDTDVTGAIVIVQSGAMIQGHVTVDGIPDATLASGIRIQPIDSMARIPVGFRQSEIAGEPGSFAFDRIPEGRFRVTAALPENLYIDDALQGGRSVYDSGFDVHAGPSAPDPLQIVVKSGAGVVEGVARDNTGMPLAGATVALVPEMRRSNPGLYESVTTDAAGTFVLRGITPGEYKIFAWQGAVPGTYYDAEFLSRFEDYGLAITVSSGSRSRADTVVTQREK
jgi:hypothetical protein